MAGFKCNCQGNQRAKKINIYHLEAAVLMNQGKNIGIKKSTGGIVVRKSFIEVNRDSHFPIQNLPYGVFSTENNGAPPNWSCNRGLCIGFICIRKRRAF